MGECLYQLKFIMTHKIVRIFVQGRDANRRHSRSSGESCLPLEGICNDVIGQIHDHICVNYEFIWYYYLLMNLCRILRIAEGMFVAVLIWFSAGQVSMDFLCQIRKQNMSFGWVACRHKMPLDATALLDTFLLEKVSEKKSTDSYLQFVCDPS